MTNTNILKAMNALGISPKQKTDPAMVRQILREMHLDDLRTSFTPIKKFLRDATTKKQNLAPMIANSVKALEERHPAILEFLGVALKKKWLKRGPAVSRALHTWYVLETFTVAMANNHALLMDVSDHLREKAKVHGIDCHHLFKTLYVAVKKTHGLFEFAKGASVDAFLTLYRLGKGMDDAKMPKRKTLDLYAKKKIDILEERLLLPGKRRPARRVSDWICINIYEAGITDSVHGFTANAAVAEALNEDMERNRYKEWTRRKKVMPDGCDAKIYKPLVRDGSTFLGIDYTQEWVSLYVTWNASFALGNLDEIERILPKLFIPSVLACKPSNFIGVRVVSLWLAITHTLFRTFEADTKPLLTEKQRREMGKAWGDINRKYAGKMLRKDLKIGRKELQDRSDRFYAHPFFNLSRILFSLWD